MNNMEDNVKSIKRKHHYQKLTLLTILFFTLCFILFIILYFTVDYQKASVYKITENSDVKYQVYLKPNNYYTSPLNEDMQYVASLIDYFNIKFNYQNKFSALTSYTYTYSISATINVYDSSNGTKKLYTSTENILNPVSKSVKNKELTLDLEENIDYVKYNGLVDNLRKDYALDVNSEVVVNLNVNLQGTTANISDPIIVNSTTSITIPLTEKTLNISATKKEVNTSKDFYGKSKLKFKNIVLLTLAFICLFMILITLIKIIKTIIKIIKSRTEYEKELKKILKEYDRTIVEIKNDSSFEITDDIIKVSSFT